MFAAGSLAQEKPKDLVVFRPPPNEARMVVGGFLWVEAEDFADYGEWKLDTQFVHKMGSAYLLACGVGKPVGEAATEVHVPQAGTWRVWARTKNWLPEFSPGRFTVAVDGKRSARTLGAAPQAGWLWENAGEFELKAGEVRLALVDLSGAFARCDALLLTRDLAYVPPVGLEACRRERARLTGLPQEIADEGAFDVVVVGAGTAGMGAAVAAARTGARTALVHDRPVLGGNASAELGVPTCGASVSHPNARESGLNEEANLWRGKLNSTYSDAYAKQAEGEKNLTVFNNRRVNNVEMRDKTAIASVLAVDTLTHKTSRIRGKLFIDCTGDGWVGYYAGAHYRLGRESRDEFGETAAPERADAITMSGCIMGNHALGYRAVDTGAPVDYTPPPWAVKLPPPEAFHRNPRGFTGGQWWLEHPGDVDDLEDPEFARDELIRITFAYWGWIKNGWAEKERARDYALAYVPYMDARRETRRLVGDTILKQQDAEQGVMFPDRISYGGWSLDVHHPRGIHSGKEGPYYFDGRVPIYSIPYRTLYSTNIVNLMFAGRCMSVTHIALGTVRVEATLSTAGQAAGTAAALAVKYNVTPREIGQRYIGDLQQRLLKDDQYIPELKNEDPADLARGAKITASSTQSFSEYARKNVKTDEEHELNMPRAVMFPRGLTERLGTVQLCLISTNPQPVDVKLHVRGADAACDFSSAEDLAVVTAAVPAKKRAYVPFKADIPLTQPYVWLWLPRTSGVTWALVASSMTEGCRAYGGGGGRPWTVVKGQQYAFFTEPSLRFATDHAPQNVVDGVSRIVGKESHLWSSDPYQPLPQWLELDFGKPVELNSVRLTFDTDLNPKFPVRPVVPQCVKDYRVEVLDGGKWVEVVKESGNFLRHRAHRFPPRTASKLRLTVDATNGDPSARVFEIRAYRE
jgi:hypothetical protein